MGLTKSTMDSELAGHGELKESAKLFDFIVESAFSDILNGPWCYRGHFGIHMMTSRNECYLFFFDFPPFWQTANQLLCFDIHVPAIECDACDPHYEWSV